ncbi:MAG: zinc-binding alcohol dehydrogenase family protein [Azoarcus sp.]|jgi:zinc-binding alcohol dehydrogenase family protein|nr:zinc-binding alcohol dehydrogenase family protein [Azoarcus sp.]MDD2874047.1 zinc-binding alcohol dehydrogenase family protein [Azoarcus sp.]
MKAVAYQNAHSITDNTGLQDVVLPDPVATGRDLLVEVKAVSVNPVDTKVRANASAADGDWKVLGWDASGLVRAVGPEVTEFKVGDRVWYAGDITRSGTNAELHLVDERVVGHMPASLDFAQAAALPLTSITAWEMLFDRLRLKADTTPTNERLLIIGASGGVGSIMTQLASRLTGATVIGTASRPETEAWVRELGAHHVINHTLPLAEELKRIGIDEVTHVVSLTKTHEHFPHIVEAIAPQGKFGLIDDPEPIDVRLLKRKSVSLHWELMFTRSMFGTDDMIAQHRLLDEMARLVDAGTIRSTVAEHFGSINAANLKRAHALLESGKARGKIVLEGFAA